MPPLPRRLRLAAPEAALELWRRLRAYHPRRLWRRALFRRANRSAAEGEIVVRPGLRLRIDPRSREPFEWFCFRSLEMVDELDAFAREMAACRRFLDVGACHGLFAMAFAHGRPATRALAVEPSAVAEEILAGNLRRDGLDNVALARVALGGAAGVVRMRPNWHHLEAVAAGEEGNVEVTMRTLDALCAELAFHPDLAKIDVEGFEHAVLSGAQEVLRRDRPRLFLEVHPARLAEFGRSTAEVLGLLAQHGYRFYGLRGAPRAARDLIRRDRVFRILCLGEGSPAARQPAPGAPGLGPGKGGGAAGLGG